MVLTEAVEQLLALRAEVPERVPNSPPKPRRDPLRSDFERERHPLHLRTLEMQRQRRSGAGIRGLIARAAHDGSAGRVAEPSRFEAIALKPECYLGIRQPRREQAERMHRLGRKARPVAPMSEHP